MHARRALLLFALVLALTAIAAAVSPSREDDSSPARAAPASPVSPPRMISFEVGPRAVASPPVRAGERVIVTVKSGDGGYVRIPRLRRSAYVTPAAPVRFNLLAPDAGRYDVTFEETATAEPTRIGTLITRP